MAMAMATATATSNFLRAVQNPLLWFCFGMVPIDICYSQYDLGKILNGEANHTLTFAAASLICSIVKTPKKSSSVTAFTTANATSSTLTGGASSRSDAGRDLKGLVKFSVAFRSLSSGSPIKSRGISNPPTLLFPCMTPGLRTTPGEVRIQRITVKNSGLCGEYSGK